MQYHDFEVRIGARDGEAYPVELTRAPLGVGAKGRLALSVTDPTFDRQVERLESTVLRSGSTRRGVRLEAEPEPAPREFGTALFDRLFAADDLRSALQHSRALADRENVGLRIRLRIDAPELATLPWEFLYDASAGEFLALSRWTPIVRHLETKRQRPALVVAPPIKVLVMIASPINLATLDVAAERDRIDRATARLQAEGVLSIRWMPGATWADLQDELRNDDYHIFHFVGHGGFDSLSRVGTLAFVRADGQATMMSAIDVSRLLSEERSLRLVLLNSCSGAKADSTNPYSSTAAALVRAGTPAVVAMQYEISDPAALEFSTVLYKEIVAGSPIDAAVSAARTAVSLHGKDSLEWVTPVLHMTSADGRLFDISAAPTRPVRASTPRASQTPAPHAPERATPAGQPAARRSSLWLGGGALVAAMAAVAVWKDPRPAPSPAGTAAQVDTAIVASADTAAAVPRSDSVAPLVRPEGNATTTATGTLAEAATSAARALTAAELAVAQERPLNGFTVTVAGLRSPTSGGYAGALVQSAPRVWTWGESPFGELQLQELSRRDDLVFLLNDRQEQVVLSIPDKQLRVPKPDGSVDLYPVAEFQTRRPGWLAKKLRYAGLVDGSLATVADAGTMEAVDVAGEQWRLVPLAGGPPRTFKASGRWAWGLTLTASDGEVWYADVHARQLLVGPSRESAEPRYRVVEVR